MKTNARSATVLRRAGACVLLLGGLLVSAGCVVRERVAYQGGGVAASAYYDYDYYPDGDVYYYPEGRLYYWNEGGRWLSGPQLPSRYHVQSEHREHMRTHTRDPWTERRRDKDHEEHEEHER